MMTEVKVMVFGGAGVGKRALTERFCPDNEYDPTLEDSHRKEIDVDGWQCIVDIQGIMGEGEYTALRDQYIRVGQVFILAYSITSRTSFSRIREFHNNIQEVKEYTRVNATSDQSRSERPYNVSIILAGTKNDLEAQREVSVEEGQMLAKSLGCWFIETSAKNNTNVDKLFYDSVRWFRQKNPPIVPQTPAPPQSKKGLGRLLGSRQRKKDDGSRCVVI
ncbi:uncharacterized protein N7500_003614 [Penicillium coprophilum]|uniref:uncharacterized protein n=1 Tax=Penicillium coprophilum TaxID=36646 RepID=UPI0023A23685|nr:uncharacterized protein N7500_003614 [Penicillium coprophilum]KAJ5170831.1 hypothetical protein N7500_003614 [Penicillium coprophilum]